MDGVLLILDELGYVPAGKLGSELLFDVISTAYERLRLIVTATRQRRFTGDRARSLRRLNAPRDPKDKAALRPAV